MGDEAPLPTLAELFCGLCDPWENACFLVTAQGELVAGNQAGARLLGSAAGELPGRSLGEFVTNPCEMVQRYLVTCWKNRQQVPGVLTRLGSDGQEIRYRCFGHRFDLPLTPQPLVFLRCTASNEMTNKFIALNEQLETQHRIQQQLLLERDQLQIEIGERRRVEEELRTTSNTLNMIIENLPDMMILKDAEKLQFVRLNHAGEELLGCSREKLLGKSDHDMFPKEQADFFAALDRQVLQGNVVIDIPEEPIQAGKGTRILHTKKVPICDGAGKPIYLLGISEDITERKQAEEERVALQQQLLHAQKLESLGVLAGGIAHDFNNILMAIVGNADLALMKSSPEAPAMEYLRNIEQAATRAADLAKQMLAYSGKGKFFVEQIDLNRLLQEMLHMLEVSISKKAVLRLNLNQPLTAIEADATQLRQIVMNLVINASEAIGDRSGTISITTGCIDCDIGYLQYVWRDGSIPPGRYVYLEVADSGCGMDQDTAAKIFDPFFTTKFTGRGLGLSAVLGIVRGHRGAIKVYSEPGKGTTFKVLFPVSGKEAALEEQFGEEHDWQGTGVVLLVDDEEAVRSIGAAMLKELGFTPLPAADGKEAVEIYREHPDIELAILDLTMPHLDGEQCFQELRRINPAVKVIMSSGYNEQEIVPRFAGKGLAGFVQKPYTLNILREAVRKAQAHRAEDR